MTVMVNESDKRFHGSGSAGPFTWTWRFLANTDIKVYRILEPNEEDLSLEVRTLLVEGEDYTLTGAESYTGGSLTLEEVLAADTDLLIKRMTEPLQEVSIRNQGNNFRPSVHEEIFDRQVMMIQDRDREVSSNAEEITGIKARMATAEADIVEIQADVAAIDAHLTQVEELAESSVVVYDAPGSPDLVVYADASLGNIEVELVAADDANAKHTTVIKVDDTANTVTVTVPSGTIAEFDPLSGENEVVRLMPRSTNNHWYKVN
jgi:hypothetical protein